MIVWKLIRASPDHEFERLSISPAEIYQKSGTESGSGKLKNRGIAPRIFITKNVMKDGPKWTCANTNCPYNSISKINQMIDQLISGDGWVGLGEMLQR